MRVVIVDGDLLDQPVEAIVNAWNRNVIPWWLLLPQGVSGAIKRSAGMEPFRELARHGPMALGEVVATGAGRLPYRAILHAAGINLLWRASRDSIARSASNAVDLAGKLGLQSLAFPIIGAGSGGFRPDEAERILVETLSAMDSSIGVIVVRFRPEGRARRDNAEPEPDRDRDV